jgi:hypothetical protein
MIAYSVGTWDADAQAYTPQVGLSVPSIGIDKGTLRTALKELRSKGYTAHRVRDSEGSYDDNDWSVLVERTDDMTEAEVLESWRR